MGPVNAAVPPRGEAKSNMRIFQELAGRLGFGEALAGDPWDWIARAWAPLEKQGISMEAVKTGPVRRRQPEVPYGDGIFPTPDGRFQFVDAYEGRPEPEDGFFLLMVKNKAFLNSQLLEEDAASLPTASLNPAVMADADIREGQRIWLSNDLDRVEAVARPSNRTRPDVVELSPSMWKNDRGGINRLRPALLSDLGPTAAVNETKVFVKKA
jgi:anaerobic selenocysteine-containing dehydrogenase